MNIADVCRRLAALEQDLAVDIDGIGEFKVARAYESVVPTDETPEFPCFLHKWTPNGMLAVNGYPGGWVMDEWAVHVQLLVSEYPTDFPQYAEAASRLFVAWREMLMRNMKLGDSDVTVERIRIEQEQPTVIGEEGATRYIGFDCFLDITLRETFLVGPG